MVNYVKVNGIGAVMASYRMVQYGADDCLKRVVRSGREEFMVMSDNSGKAPPGLKLMRTRLAAVLLRHCGGPGKAAEPCGVTRGLSRRTTRGFQYEAMAPRNRIELLTRGFSVQNDETFIQQLDYLVAVGKAANELKKLLVIEAKNRPDRPDHSGITGDQNVLTKYLLSSPKKKTRT